MDNLNVENVEPEAVETLDADVILKDIKPDVDDLQAEINIKLNFDTPKTVEGVDVNTGTDAFIVEAIGLAVVIIFGLILLLLRKAFKGSEILTKFISSPLFMQLFNSLAKTVQEKATKAAVDEARKRNIKTFDWVPQDIINKYGEQLNDMSKEKIQELINKEKEHGRNDESSSGDKV